MTCRALLTRLINGQQYMEPLANQRRIFFKLSVDYITAASSWERIALTGPCIYISTAPLSHQQSSKINSTLATGTNIQPESINNQVGADDMNIASSSIQLVNMSRQPRNARHPIYSSTSFLPKGFYFFFQFHHQKSRLDQSFPNGNRKVQLSAPTDLFFKQPSSVWEREIWRVVAAPTNREETINLNCLFGLAFLHSFCEKRTGSHLSWRELISFFSNWDEH